MRPDTVEKIRSNPRYQELVKRRRRFGWTLALLMLAIYFGFVFLIAFAPALLGTPIGEGAATLVGIPVAILVMLSAFVLTGIYVARANSGPTWSAEAVFSDKRGES